VPHLRSATLTTTVLAVLAGLVAASLPAGGTTAATSDLSAVGATVSAAPTSAAPTSAAPTSAVDPADWGNRRLAAQLVISCVDMHHLDRARRQSAAGIGAVTLLGTPPPHLRDRLRTVREAAPGRVRPFVASDEEGGLVQRLRTAIYRLPSAETMGGWRPARVRRTAEAYAVRMRRLGVRMDLAPVADLAIRGGYIDGLHRAFARDPVRVARLARAWRLGMADSGVVTVVKHWPGHGAATGDSHLGPARIPPLDVLEGRDLVPFDRELAAGAPVVMVGHLLSAGLTRNGVPTSLSPRALRYLRGTASPGTVVMTDSLAMGAVTTALGISTAQAAVRALRAGADWAMACDGAPMRAVAAVRAAIDDGRVPRRQAVESARRILDLKAAWRLTTRS
jgi:beta-N-acetylhexosaminidase